MLGSACLLYLHAMSPLHMGTGRAEGTIDLPHAREANTGYPLAPGSGIKGVLRDEFDDPDRTLLFGGDIGDPESNQAAQQGALMFSDGALLCLPVPSLLGTLAWVTSPYLLHRYSRDREAIGLAPLASLADCRPSRSDECRTAPASVLRHGAGTQATVYLLDLGLPAAELESVKKVAGVISAACHPGQQPNAQAWREDFVARFAVVSDAVMGHLARMAMDVRARVRLEDETKIVKRGHLWYEESLPTETLLYAVVAADPPPVALRRPDGAMATRNDVLKRFADAHGAFSQIQLGGKATVGRGWMSTALEGAPA